MFPALLQASFLRRYCFNMFRLITDTFALNPADVARAALLSAQHVAAIARIDRVTAVQQNASLDKT